MIALPVAIISLLPFSGSFLPFQALSHWVFLHKKSNFNVLYLWCEKTRESGNSL